MKLKILKNFRVGSVSDPKRMIKGNVIESDSITEFTPERIEKWIKMGWVEKVTFP
ncbi:MAG TPA: hypothetical protein P5056_04020 [Candidatus Paceibacterota bacterium]|nr:hypothetical protein [Candidatus Paceibacterota bacterium]